MQSILHLFPAQTVFLELDNLSLSSQTETPSGMIREAKCTVSNKVENSSEMTDVLGNDESPRTLCHSYLADWCVQLSYSLVSMLILPFEFKMRQLKVTKSHVLSCF